MADSARKLPVTAEGEKSTAPAPSPWSALDDLRSEVDHLFQDFSRGNWPHPFGSIRFEPTFHRYFTWSTPAVDIIEKDTAFEITAELPGIEPKDVDVSLKNGSVVIKGEKQEEREEKTKEHHVKERHYGSFERSFPVPQGADISAIEATFHNGVLKVTLPKTAEAQKPSKKIEIKAA